VTAARRLVCAAAVVAVAATACGSADAGNDGSTKHTSLTVLAAASLTEAFTKIGREFEASNDGVTVRFSFGPSDGLAQQIRATGGIDVFASASPTWMDAVRKDPGVEHRVDFARNRLVIITPADDPANIGSIDDLANDGVKLVLAAEGVPAGDYAREILGNAGIAKKALANVVSNEEDVKGVVQKVALGEADAGIVYVTDVTPEVRERLAEVEIPGDVNVVATYPIAVVSTSQHASLASDFVSYVSGSNGESVLRSFGFMPPV
jgi:molybdate transport system substrate-binding protein